MVNCGSMDIVSQLPTSSLNESSSYLLIFEAESTSIVPLPHACKIMIGRSDQASIRLFDEAALPEHAQISVNIDGETAIRDLSIDGETSVNGERLTQSRFLSSGDVIAIGRAVLIFHREPRAVPERAILNMLQFQRRLREEIERYFRYGRAFTLLAIALELPCAELPDRLFAEASRSVRNIDVLGWDKSFGLFVLFPETTEAADIPSRRLLKNLVALIPQTHAALARCPQDGVDAEALLAGVRAAAGTACLGELATLSQGAVIFSLGSQTLIALDPKMKQLLSLVQHLAKSDMPVLITGETGVGKEVIAHAIHHWSTRNTARMVSFNCAAIPESLLESELFGHESGAFTGATGAKPGLMESAPGGTLFLDEIGECSSRAQVELLRVLETKQVRRVGALSERSINVRIIAATNRKLEEDITTGRFRQDLYYRLSAAVLIVPPLRDRPLDIPILARAFLEAASKAQHLEPPIISPEAMDCLLQYRWPGNIRELKHVMEYLTAIVQGSNIHLQHLPEGIRNIRAPWYHHERLASISLPSSADRISPRSTRRQTLYEEIQELEKARIREALEETDGVRVRAAEILGMPLRTLVTKMKLYGFSSIPRKTGRNANRKQ